VPALRRCVLHRNSTTSEPAPAERVPVCRPARDCSPPRRACDSLRRHRAAPPVPALESPSAPADSASPEVALDYPSLCEGFRLPMLEAAARATPAIASEDANRPPATRPAGLGLRFRL